LKYSSVGDVMHGGAAGVIFDMCTTTALGPLARPDFYLWVDFPSEHLLFCTESYESFLGGVTRTLSISYLRAIPIGTTVRIRSWVVSAGRTMAFIRSEMTSENGKKVYCTAEHHKVNIEAKSEHLAVETDWDRETGRQVKKEKL
jgi:acyl-coenzyme A thioesterase 13